MFSQNFNLTIKMSTNVCSLTLANQLRVAAVHIFMVRSRCSPIYTFCSHQKQCTSDSKDFTFVKFNSQIFISTCFFSELVC